MKIAEIMPLTPLQEGLLYASTLVEAGADPYTVQADLVIEGELDTELLHRSAQMVFDRHPNLRTCFRRRANGSPVSLVLDGAEIGWAEHDFTSSPGTAEASWDALRDTVRARRFELSKPPLLRMDIGHLGPDSWRLLVTFHHLILDGWSSPKLTREIFLTYANGGDASVLPPEVPYRDFLAWLGARESTTALARWREVLGEQPSTTIIARDEQSELGTRPALRVINDLGDLGRRLATRARESSTTLSTLIQAAWGLALGAELGRGDVIFGTTVSGRSLDLPGAERIIGMTLGAIPVRVHPDADDSVLDAARRVQREQTLVMDDHWIGLPAISADAGVGQLFDTLVVVENHQSPGADPLTEAIAQAGLRLVATDPQDSTHYPITIQVIPDPQLQIRFHYLPTAVGEQRLERLLAALLAYLRALADAPDTAVAALGTVDRSGRSAQLELGSGPLSGAPLLEDLLRAPETATGHTEPALLVAGQEISTAGLHLLIDSLATRLRAAGIGPEAIVGVALPRSVDTVVAVVAILRAGAAVLPIDLDYPSSYLDTVIADADPDLLLTHSGTEVLPQYRGRRMMVDRPESDAAAEQGASDNRAPHPENLAYLIYTSGSTGRPKAVAGTRAGLATRLGWARDAWRPAGPDIRLIKSSLAFIDGLTELLGALACGAQMVVATDAERVDPAAAARLIVDHGVTQLTAVPSLAGELAASEPDATARVRRWILSGEPLTGDVLAMLRALTPSVDVVNSYGSSEDTGDVSYLAVGAETHSVSPEDRGALPIGRPVPGAQIVLLDGFLRLVSPGTVGEIYVASPQVARGYHQQSAMTATRFVANPFGPGRLLRTGDLGSWDNDGNLEFHGRADGQVKIRGHRVELLSVESVLREIPGVTGAAVVARPDVFGNLGLWGFVTLANDTNAADSIHAQAVSQLPGYQTPEVVILDEFTTLPNGKIDRSALPDPRSLVVSGGVPPTPGTQTVLAELFSELLGVEGIDATSDFFRLGGHSLLATRLAHRISVELQAEISVRTIFDSPTVAALAAVLDASRAGGTTEPVVFAPRPDPLPASPAQRRLWVLDQLERTATGQGSPTYNLHFVVELSGFLDPERLCAAVTTIVNRHESLRTKLVVDDRDELVQIIAPPGTACEFTVHRGPQARAALAAERTRPFTLATDIPIRVALAQHGEDRATLQITVHHIAADEWCVPILFGELAEVYASSLTNSAPEAIHAEPVQYADAALWQESQLELAGPDDTSARLAERSFWRSELDGLPEELSLPYDRPRPAAATGAGAGVDLIISAATTARIHRLAATHGATPFMVIHTALVALWSRLSGSADIPIGTPVANREHPILQSVIGMFTNSVVLRTQITGDPTVAELLRQVRDVDLRALDHQQLPFQEVVDVVDPDRDLARSPLFQTFLQYRSPVTPPDFAGLTATIAPPHSDTAKFDVTVDLVEVVDEHRSVSIVGRLEYATDVFDADTVDRVATMLSRVIDEVAGDEHQRISQLSVCPPDDLAAIDRFNDTRIEHLPELAEDLPELIVAAATRHPDLPAVIYRDAALTYRELVSSARALAIRLAGVGVGVDDVVGISMRRGLALSVAVIATQMAGAAYLPLDPDDPAHRREFILRDATPTAVISDEAFVDESTPVIIVDDRGTPQQPGPIAAAPERSDRPTQRGAYLIYTSGSTGTPKAVVVDHRAIVNRLCWMQHRFALEPGERVLHKTPTGFDVSVWELFWPLIAGATIVMAAPGDHRDPLAIADTLRHHQVSTVHFVPSLLRAFLAETHHTLPELRRILCSGEALTAPLRDGVRQRFPDVRLHNLYGPTEAAVDVTEIDVTDTTGPVIPIGAPVWNTGVHVLGSRLEPLPIGIWGDLYLSGVQLARGYARRASLTANTFIAAPFATAGDRMYRTGDIARWRADGVLEYAGRSDHQLKIRGQRIEPGEIEEALLSTQALRQAICVGHRTADGRTVLAAYGVAATSTANPADILGLISEVLPAHMVPATLTLLDELPVTVNGKLDARKLPDPVLLGAGEDIDDPNQVTVAEVFADVLGTETATLGSDDDFFALGGDSIVAITLVNRLRRRGLVVSVRDIFDHRSVAGIASAAASATEDAAESAAPERDRPIPLTPIVARLAARTGHWQSLAQSITIALPDTVTVADLRQALRTVIDRHEALRLRVDTAGGIWTLRTQPTDSIEIADALRSNDIGSAATRSDFESIAAQTHARIDPTEGRCIQTVLIGDGSRFWLLLVIHHLAIDAVSWRVLIDDLEQAWESISGGVEPHLGVPPVSYSAYADSIAESASAPTVLTELKRWRTMLARASALHGQDGAGQQSDLVTTRIEIDAESSESYLHTESITADVIFDVATALDDWRISQGNSSAPLLVDVEGHGRDIADLDLSRTVGWLTAIAPVLVDPAAADPLADLVTELARDGQTYGLARYCNARTARVLAGAPRADILVNYLGTMDLSGRTPWRPAPESRWTRTSPAADLAAEYAVTVDIRAERGDGVPMVLVADLTLSGRVFDDAARNAIGTALAARIRKRAELNAISMSG